MDRTKVDYSKTFSPFVKLSTLRTVLAIAAKRNMHSADIETTFLNVDLKKEIYMRQPRGSEDGTFRVVQLLKSIYELKHASCAWCKVFHQTLSSIGLIRETSVTILYTMNHQVHGTCIVLVYVDDSMNIFDSLKWIVESAKRAIGNNSA
jgi:hypothetical protein